MNENKIDDIEDFKYEFDFKFPALIPFFDCSYNLFIGYTSLHQLTRQDLFNLTNEELIKEFNDSLEENEIFTFNGNNFTFILNNITNEIINYIKMLLKYLLILYNDFKIDKDNNTIIFTRINE